MNRKVMKAFGMVRGVSHSEFIRGRDDGQLYFLETSARVGGAHIVDLIETATGINMWAEWAKVEIAGGKAPYQPPSPRKDSRRAAGFAGAAGTSRHLGLQRSGDCVANGREETPRGTDCEIARREAGAGVASELRPANAAGLPCIAAAPGAAELLTALRSSSFSCSQPSAELEGLFSRRPARSPTVPAPVRRPWHGAASCRGPGGGFPRPAAAIDRK